MDLSDALLEFLAASSRMAKHVHAPLQSGCDRTLRAMKRRYRTRHYQDRIERAFALMPDAAFGADVMTGFPGETNEDFEESRGFIESMPFTYLHVFPYSERPGTPAAERPDSVPVEVRRERAGVLRALAAAKNRAFRTSQLGKTFTAVTLYQRRAAMTSNYLKLALARDAEPNWMIQVTAASLTEDGLAEAGAKSPAVLRVLSTT